MELKTIFDDWAKSTKRKYARKQWLLSKWEVIEGIEWPEEKVNIMIESIHRALLPTQSDLVIDLGCGGGWIAQSLQPYAKKVFGLDISLQMLINAKGLLESNRLICGEISRLPIRSDSFDRILSYYVFMNFRDDVYAQTAILEIMRILKKGGRAVIGQLPDEAGSSEYDRDKAEYLTYCKQNFNIGKSNRNAFTPPIKLFNRKLLIDFLKKKDIEYEFRDSFNPFYRKGQSETIPWRFDLILTKTQDSL